MAVQKINVRFNTSSPTADPKIVGPSLPVDQILEFGDDVVDFEEMKLEDARDAYDDLLKIEDDLLGVYAENDLQVEQLDNEKRKVGFTDELFDNMDESILNNRSEVARIQSMVKRITKGPVYSNIKKSQKEAEQWREFVRELEGKNPTMADLAKRDYIENYAKLDMAKDKAARNAGDFSGVFKLSKSAYKDVDVDKEFTGMLADLEKDYTFEYTDIKDGAFVGIETKEGYKLSDPEVINVLKGRLREQMANDKSFENNMKAFAGVNSGGATEVTDAFLEQFIRERYKKGLKVDADIRNAPKKSTSKGSSGSSSGGTKVTPDFPKTEAGDYARTLWNAAKAQGATELTDIAKLNLKNAPRGTTITKDADGNLILNPPKIRGRDNTPIYLYSGEPVSGGVPPGGDPSNPNPSPNPPSGGVEHSNLGKGQVVTKSLTRDFLEEGVTYKAIKGDVSPSKLRQYAEALNQEVGFTSNLKGFADEIPGAVWDSSGEYLYVPVDQIPSSEPEAPDPATTTPDANGVTYIEDGGIYYAIKGGKRIPISKEFYEKKVN